MEYKIVSRLLDNTGEWQESLAAEINGLAEFGWRPDLIALSDDRVVITMRREITEAVVDA